MMITIFSTPGLLAGELRIFVLTIRRAVAKLFSPPVQRKEFIWRWKKRVYSYECGIGNILKLFSDQMIIYYY